MTEPQERTLYASDSGDRWSLVRSPSDGSVVVRHRPNEASGGRASDVGLRSFLAGSGNGPERQALLAMIGDLLGNGAPTHVAIEPVRELAHDVGHALREIEMLLNTLARRSGSDAVEASRDDLLRASRELAEVGRRISERLKGG